MDKKDPPEKSTTEMVWDIAQKMGTSHQSTCRTKRKKPFKVLLAVDAFEYTVEAFECKWSYFMLTIPCALMSTNLFFQCTFTGAIINQEGAAIMPKIVLIPVDWSEFAEKAFDCEYKTLWPCTHYTTLKVIVYYLITNHTLLWTSLWNVTTIAGPSYCK